MNGPNVSTAAPLSCDYWFFDFPCPRCAGIVFSGEQSAAYGTETFGRQVKTCCFFFFGGIVMRALEEKILKEGKIFPGEILNVGSFLNQQIDSVFCMEMGKEAARLFADSTITKILTVEASGIAFAVSAGAALGVPMAFAKKHKSANVGGDVFHASVRSYTHGTVNEIVISRDYLQKGDKVLLADDFLASGEALRGLAELCRQAEAEIVGAVVAVEKWYQGGGDSLRKEGIRVESLAKIRKMTDDSIEFCQ